MALEKYTGQIVVEECDDERVVELLDEQNIISVFGGGSESGRRALGNRSILADPRSPDSSATLHPGTLDTSLGHRAARRHDRERSCQPRVPS